MEIASVLQFSTESAVCEKLHWQFIAHLHVFDIVLPTVDDADSWAISNLITKMAEKTSTDHNEAETNHQWRFLVTRVRSSRT